MPFFTTLNSEFEADIPSKLHRHPLTGISVLVVGAGPVGLYTALECWRKGHNVVGVLDRTAGPSSAGDSFTVNGYYIQRSWPSIFRFLEESTFDIQIAYHMLSGKRISGPESFDIRKIANGRGADDGTPGPSRSYRVSRPAFTAAMLAQVQELGIKVRFNQRVLDYLEDTSKAGVFLDDGTKLEADVVVAADGVGTKSHKLINGRDIRALTSGHSIFRTAYSVEHLTSNSDLETRFPKIGKEGGVFEVWSGEGISLAICCYIERMEWVITHKDLDGTSQESWGNFVTGQQVADFLSTFPEVPDYLLRLVKTAPEDSIVDWKLLWRDPQPNWTSPLGRVVQAGDSAHTFVPSSGSGVNQGMEDAVSIATCLQIGGNLESGMWSKVHNKLRFERVSCCQLLGFINQSRYLNPGWGNKAMDGASNIKPDYGWWILGHNPEHYAYSNYGKALRHLVEGTPFQNTNIPPGYIYKTWTLKDIHEMLEQGKRLEFDGDWS